MAGGTVKVVQIRANRGWVQGFGTRRAITRRLWLFALAVVIGVVAPILLDDAKQVTMAAVAFWSAAGLIVVLLISCNYEGVKLWRKVRESPSEPIELSPK